MLRHYRAANCGEGSTDESGGGGMTGQQVPA